MLKQRFTRSLSRFGMDRAIAYTVLARVIQAAGGVISIIFVAKYLGEVEQGYYYTFGSILAIQIFFELGLSSIITQFAAHEAANLHWLDETELEGSTEAKSRLSSLLRFSIKWFAVVAVILVFILIIAGSLFFKRFEDSNYSINWEIPFIILSLSTACSLLVSPILAFLEGLGKIHEVARIRLFQQLIQLSVLYAGLLLGFKLFSSPIAAILAFMVIPTYIFSTPNLKLLKWIWSQLGESRINYKSEIFPYQWRIALSWMSGYFIFQLFNPVLFATEGSAVAGQMGMTLAALNGILAVSLSWVNTKVPIFSQLIAQKKYTELDNLFKQTVKYTSVISGTGLLIFIILVYLLKRNEVTLGNRFLPLIPLGLLCIATFVNQIVSAMATYLRCHKQEPLLSLSVIVGVLTCLSTIFLGKFFGVLGVTMGYTTILVLVSLTGSLMIFKKKRNLWH